MADPCPVYVVAAPNVTIDQMPADFQCPRCHEPIALHELRVSSIVRPGEAFVLDPSRIHPGPTTG